MDDLHVESAYIVHSQVIGVGDCPFPSMKTIRSIWHPLFKSKKCFTDFSNLIYDSYVPVIGYDQLPSKPFIKNIGSIWLNSRSSRLESSADRYELGSYFKDTNEIGYDNYPDSQDTIFGYDSTLDDQRMNYLYYEICKPIVIKAKTDDETQAEGKIFIHIHPSGYLVLQIAIALNWHDSQSLQTLNKLILQTRPWRRDNHWIWSSRIGNGKLSEITKIIYNNLQKSFYTSSLSPLHLGKWKSSLKIMSAADSKQIASSLLLLEDGYEVLDMQNRETCMRYLISSHQGLICIFKPKSNRKSALRFFWKIVFLSEFIEYKRQIYEDYSIFLQNEVQNLTDFRLSIKRKIKKEDLLKFSVYDPIIPEFIFALNKHIKQAAPFHRKIYSIISMGSDFDSLRERLINRDVKEWREEVDKWNPSLILLWNKIIFPIRSLVTPLK